MAVELVVGLGNPGAEYAATRHNIGFRVVDELARRRTSTRWAREGPSLVAVVELGRRVVLAKPETFMNRSGTAVLTLATVLGVEPSSILVVADDIDLPLGRLRLRRSGGPGTHNGLRDVVAALGTNFPRLRVGVRGELPWHDLADYVLAPFAPDELERADLTGQRAADAVEVALREGLDPAMERYNRPAE
jgi:PTH1 family peptidyl-tRNA hydrolase